MSLWLRKSQSLASSHLRRSHLYSRSWTGSSSPLSKSPSWFSTFVNLIALPHPLSELFTSASLPILPLSNASVYPLSESLSDWHFVSWENSFEKTRSGSQVSSSPSDEIDPFFPFPASISPLLAVSSPSIPAASSWTFPTVSGFVFHCSWACLIARSLVFSLLL